MCDKLDVDFFGAGLHAFVVVGAVAEAFGIHLPYHGERAGAAR